MVQPLSGKNSPLGRVKGRRGAAVKPGKRRRTRRLTQDEQNLVSWLMMQEVDYIDSEEFHRSDAKERIFDKAPEIDRPDVSWYRPMMEVGSPKGRTQKSVILTYEQERVIFLQYNYSRHMLNEIKQRIDGAMPDVADARDLIDWYSRALKLREQIAETNLALVLAMAKRTRMSEVDFADLVSEGNMALLRSVDKFDCGRGFKFSTYACRSILKAFSRQGMKLSKYRQRFPTDFDPEMEKSDHLETVRKTHEEECADEVKAIVSSNLADLSSVEQQVIYYRFGLGDDTCGARPMNQSALTLEQVGQIIGVTKERVRQIQNKALKKIRSKFERSVYQDSRIPLGTDN